MGLFGNLAIYSVIALRSGVNRGDGYFAVGKVNNPRLAPRSGVQQFRLQSGDKQLGIPLSQSLHDPFPIAGVQFRRQVVNQQGTGVSSMEHVQFRLRQHQGDHQ